MREHETTLNVKLKDQTKQPSPPMILKKASELCSLLPWIDLLILLVPYLIVPFFLANVSNFYAFLFNVEC